ncbi:MAG: response regulator [Elusimicrobiota bacterium]|jgi:putative two-component system response regulator|nr:response regulator [Elusimicrobiota bacterium]
MAKQKILVVDDIDINREILKEILQEDYDIIEAKNGIEAIEKVMHYKNDLSLVLLDIMMPEMDGYEALETLAKSGYTNKIPVIIITAAGGNENEVRGLELGAADYITKPFFPESVLRRVESQLELTKHRKYLEKVVHVNVEKIIEMRDNLVDFLATIVEYRDGESGGHIKRTRLMMEELFKLLSKSKKLEKEMLKINREDISKAAALHDIGKISIPDNILLKPGKLTPEEFEIMKTHSVKGAKLIDGMEGINPQSYVKACRDIALYHHERWDGKGYPEGLSGDNIPLAARAMAVVDVYDAITNKRVYKPAFSHEEALDLISKGAGTQFDPEIAEIFVQNGDIFKNIENS